jgi:predicted cytidylate kinase
MIITIGGNLGAGKTTLATRLSKKLGYEELYMGGLMREMAAEQKMTIEQFYSRLKKNPEFEKSLDERQEKLMHEKENLIAQGRVAWFFAKKSPHKVFNIFLAVSPEVGAQRTNLREKSEGKPPEEAITTNAFRANLEVERYKMLYGIENFLDPTHYDFVLDTTTLTEQEVFDTVMQKISSLL